MNRFGRFIVVSCLLVSSPALADIAVDERNESPREDVEAPKNDDLAKHEAAVKPDEAATPEESADAEAKEATKTSGCSTSGNDLGLISLLAGFGLVFVSRKRR